MKKILLEGVYGPNSDSPNFYSEEVFKRIQDWNPSYALYSGDWNIVQNTEVRVGNERKNIHEQNDVYFSLFTLVITSHEGLNRALVKRPL